LQQPVGLIPFIQGSRSFPDSIAKLELGNEVKLNELHFLWDGHLARLGG
jgi:hypothetical protein